MLRQIIIDTETTGLRTEDGHRIIEIGCLEMIDRRLTGKYYHQYINPKREIDAGALAIHGISNEFLADKPFFIDIANELMEFIKDAELIIHNAPFDVGFLNYELALTRQGWKTINDHCNTIIDTLQIARKLHAGQRNNLDALCKRYGIDNSKRDLHGALLDANLLAQVYLIMTGGQGSFFDGATENLTTNTKNLGTVKTNVVAKQYTLPVLQASPDELQQHEEYLNLLSEKGKCVWKE